MARRTVRADGRLAGVEDTQTEASGAAWTPTPSQLAEAFRRMARPDQEEAIRLLGLTHTSGLAALLGKNSRQQALIIANRDDFPRPLREPVAGVRVWLASDVRAYVAAGLVDRGAGGRPPWKGKTA